jgi:hypothetical protein
MRIAPTADSLASVMHNMNGLYQPHRHNACGAPWDTTAQGGRGLQDVRANREVTDSGLGLCLLRCASFLRWLIDFWRAEWGSGGWGLGKVK